MPGWYRRLGADLPFGDPRRAHGVAMEGYFWRLTDARAGRVVVALCGVCRAPGGPWATVSLAAHPGGFGREAAVEGAWADERGLGARAGDGTFSGTHERVQVDLGPDARLDVALHDVVAFPRRPFGGLGLAHAVPGLSQYWHPHALGGRATGRVVLGDEVVELDGAEVYAEKNWGRGGFPREWWWGQAHGFERPDVTVAFGGGEVGAGPVRTTATALVVRLGRDVVRLGDPLLSPVRATVGGGRWHLRGRSARWSVELRGEADPAGAHVLPVPLPLERRNVPGALEHLGGRARLEVRRRGRVVFEGASDLAGLEHGGLRVVAAELERRRATPALGDREPAIRGTSGQAP